MCCKLVIIAWHFFIVTIGPMNTFYLRNVRLVYMIGGFCLIWLFSDKCMHTQIAEQLQFSKKNRTFTIGNVRRQRKWKQGLKMHSVFFVNFYWPMLRVRQPCQTHMPCMTHMRMRIETSFPSSKYKPKGAVQLAMCTRRSGHACGCLGWISSLWCTIWGLNPSFPSGISRLSRIQLQYLVSNYKYLYL